MQKPINIKSRNPYNKEAFKGYIAFPNGVQDKLNLSSVAYKALRDTSFHIV